MAWESSRVTAPILGLGSPPGFVPGPTGALKAVPTVDHLAEPHIDAASVPPSSGPPRSPSYLPQLPLGVPPGGPPEVSPLPFTVPICASGAWSLAPFVSRATHQPETRAPPGPAAWLTWVTQGVR
ncbi:hypothetical protein GCM10020367_26640 [Streptomyces sannanensis]|uniref:Uncharacterized protein n=1 Tax=Streptomyces sannanensis TaxID=285536 RepID=A0ABP6SAN0_9ACTN